MDKHNETTPTFTMREFIRSPKRASDLLRQGKKILVTNNGTPLFTAIPETTATRGATFTDFAGIKANNKTEKDLSQKIDQLLYGA